MKGRYSMQKDYILRIIEQFVQALVSIMSSRKDGRYEEALGQIDTASRKYLNSEISFFLDLTPDQLVEYFKGNSSHIDTERGIICADLLYELALICEEKRSLNESLSLKIMSLNLYLTIIPEDVDFQVPDYEKKISEILKIINIHSLPKKIQEKILQYQKFSPTKI
jgi:hypothetical protein